MSGSRYSGKDTKFNQLNQQELLLAKKIEEIKAKNEAGSKKDLASSSSKDVATTGFSNDGNFMNNYLNMKEGKTETGIKREAPTKGKSFGNKKSRFSSMFQQMKKTQVKTPKVEPPSSVTATCFHNDNSSSDEEQKSDKAKPPQPSKPKSTTPSALITSPTNVQYKVQAAAAKINNAVATNLKVTPAKAKPRKNRWGEKIDLAEIAPVGMANIAGVPDIPVPQIVMPRMLSADEKKQLDEQRDMQAMYSLIMANRTQQQLAAAPKQMKVQHEYDSDEEIDDAGGTWEHVKRRQEMEKTQALAEKLTDEADGKHFIGDFLPPAELAKFMETFKALKEGRTPDYSDYKEFKIQCDNVGFKMLQKMGWDEGQGLGNEGQGIVQPVNQGQKSIDGRGLGVEKPAELSKNDDDFSAYRKRMMLAYRFRPNPLNNPRRPYY